MSSSSLCPLNGSPIMSSSITTQLQFKHLKAWLKDDQTEQSEWLLNHLQVLHKSLLGSPLPIPPWSQLFRQLRKICPLQGSILKDTLFIQPSKMDIFYGMSQAPACVTPVVPARMIGKKTLIVPPKKIQKEKTSNLMSPLWTQIPQRSSTSTSSSTHLQKRTQMGCKALQTWDER